MSSRGVTSGVSISQSQSHQLDMPSRAMRTPPARPESPRLARLPAAGGADGAAGRASRGERVLVTRPSSRAAPLPCPSWALTGSQKVWAASG